jgi:hypothetical protein
MMTNLICAPVIGAALAALTMVSAGASAGNLPDLTVPQSCAVQLKSNNHSAQDLDQVQSLGVKWVRRGFIWESVEKAPGQYDFSAYDRLMNDCGERGLGVVGCIAFGNKLYGPVWEEKGRAAYARFAAALAEHYKDRKVMWEIWNEPNTQTFWGKHGKHNSEQFADEYVGLLKAAVAAMKQANPDCVVMGGSTSGVWSASYEWMDFCFAKGALKSGIDAWSVHPYSTKSPEGYIEAYATVRQLMLKNGASQDFPILNSERGYPLGKAEGYAGGDENLSRQYQAWHFVRQYMIDLLCNVRLTNWYEWSGKEGFSLVEDGRQTPAYRAARVMIEQLDGYKLAERLPLKSDRDFVLRFTKASAPDKLVAWTAPPEGGSPDETTPHAVAVPAAISGWVETTTIYGQAGGVQVNQGSIQLPLSGAPQYVTLHAVPAPLALPGPAAALPAPDKPAQAQPAQPAGPSTDLKLFDKDVAWKFEKNTGDGSFTLSAEGDKPIGVMTYDFSKSKSKSTPYILASAPVSIPEGTTAVQLKARSAIKHRVTIRLIDQTGQTHQYKLPVAGSGDWVSVRMNLKKKAEHWGGANDGKIHFPIQQIVLSIPAPAGDVKTGKMEFTDAVAIGG